MMKIEKFLETRARQSEEQARMIRKYIDNPELFNTWKGSKFYVEQNYLDAKLDSEKCYEALRYLKTKYLNKRKPKTVKSK
jgi:hypothetical protein